MKQETRWIFGLLFASLLAVWPTAPALCQDSGNPPLRWWKGNLHTHSLWSDGNQFPEMIAQWYRDRGYDFLALSDHNVLSQGERWMKLSEIVQRGGAGALEAYQQQFGPAWVETRGEPDSDSLEVRLKPMDEFRGLVEVAGEFLMIPCEEISDRAEGAPVHLNATNLLEVIQPVGGATVREAMANNLRAVQDQATRLGREILLHVNHPNFGWAITAEELAAVTEERFVEVYNGHPGINHLGDALHPSIEQLWDIANTIRLGRLGAAPLFGLGTDDSHHYYGKQGSRPGRGWIMVRSRYLTPEHLLRAIKRGDFYASSGVVLADVAFDPEKGTLSLDIEPAEGVTYTTEFIGTRKTADLDSQPRLDDAGEALRVTGIYSADVGAVLAKVEGLHPRYQLDGSELYVRAVVTSSRPHVDPSFAGQVEQAWTQPVGWRSALPDSTHSGSPAGDTNR